MQKITFGVDFVKKINQIFKIAQQEDKFVFMHGTFNLDNAISIMLNGLECEYPELFFTSDLMNKDDKLLFEKLKSWPHWDLKYLLTICVPKAAGKGGIPIWNRHEKIDGFFILPPQFINGIIDVNQKLILPNPRYNSSTSINATIEDRSFEPKTGKYLEVTLPQMELEIYEQYEERE